eukprot:gene45315-50388_t
MPRVSTPAPAPEAKRRRADAPDAGVAADARTRKSLPQVLDKRPMRNVLVTGGLGFIGSNFINYGGGCSASPDPPPCFARRHPECHIYNLDCGDYVSNEKNIDPSVASGPRYTLVRGDIGNSDLVMHLLRTHDIDTIVNFAAQTHVDNSFGNSMCFTRTNVLGTHNLLECSKTYGKLEKFVHVSTDEVYGEVEEHQKESATLNPTNPYAATKAAAEFIVKAYRKSFDLPTLITRGNNVYGPRQYPEKVIPRFIWLLHQGKKLTVQGSGRQQRTFVHCKGVLGGVYNIGTVDEKSVLEIAEHLLSIMKPGEG